MKYEIKKLKFWELIGRSITMCINNSGFFLPIMTLLYLPFIVAEFISVDLINGNMTLFISYIILFLILFLILQSFATGLIALITWKKYLGEKVKLLSLAGRVLSHIIQLTIIITILLVLVITCLLPLFSLIIIWNLPGLASTTVILPIVLSVCCVAISIFLLALLIVKRVIVVPVSIIEKLGLFRTGKRSQELLSGSKMWVLGMCLILFLLMIVYYVLYITLVIADNYYVLEFDTIVVQVVGKYLFFLLFTPLCTIFSTLIYCNMRIEKEGFDVERLSSQFEVSGTTVISDRKLSEN